METFRIMMRVAASTIILIGALFGTVLVTEQDYPRGTFMLVLGLGLWWLVDKREKP